MCQERFRLGIRNNLLTERAAKHWHREAVQSPPLEALKKPADVAPGVGPGTAVLRAGLGGATPAVFPKPSPASTRVPGPPRRHSPRLLRSSLFPPAGRGPWRHRRAPAAPPARPPGIMSPPLFSLPEARLRFTVSLPRLPPAFPPALLPSLHRCRSDGSRPGSCGGRAVPRRQRARGPGAPLRGAQRGRGAAVWERE